MAKLEKQEIIGYIIALLGAGMVVPVCLLIGITHFNYLSSLFWEINIDSLKPLLWAKAIFGFIVLIAGLAIASAAEKEPNFFE